MISYAQNQEDVVLWRALKNIGNGFYIDVGANDPVVDSVTKWFYDSGWNGINIEPLEEYYNEYTKHRKRDINLQCVVTERGGDVTFYEAKSTGLSTLKKEFVENIKERGFEVSEKIVKSMSLNEICEKFCSGREIHFLKIDVEGAEADVIKSIDLQRFRPWIILVEMSVPPIWENKLLSSNYHFVLFDGINRFYVAVEKEKEIGDLLSIPVNFKDEYVRGSFVGNEADEAEHVAENLYKYILGRTPESRQAVVVWADLIRKYGFENIRRRFIKSDEFGLQYKELCNVFE